MKNFYLTSVLWKEDVGYVSKCPELGVASAGDTPEEAVENLKEAVELYLENAEKLGILSDLQAPLEATEKFTSILKVAAK